jgi:hypothetical protein
MKQIPDHYFPRYVLEAEEVPSLETFLSVYQPNIARRDVDFLVPLTRNQELAPLMIAGGCRQGGTTQEHVIWRKPASSPEQTTSLWNSIREQQAFEIRTKEAAEKAAIDANPYLGAFQLFNQGWISRFDEVSRRTMVWLALNEDIEDNKTWSQIVPMFGSISSFHWDDNNLRTFMRRVKEIHATAVKR